jgi:hypothetical protein
MRNPRVAAGVTGLRPAAPRRDTRPAANTTPRSVLLAPIPVFPCKPLTPTHVKGLLWMDVMYRATAQLLGVTYRYSLTTYHPTVQNLAFWEFLDRTQGDRDYSSLSGAEIGDLYVRHRHEDTTAPVDALATYAQAVERSGWVHPAATRILEEWAGHYRRLGIHDPGLLAHQPPSLPLEELVRRLSSAGLAVDHRQHGGPAFLDGTRFGLPLRKIVTEDGHANYLACALRELLPLCEEHDAVVLAHDPELHGDYQLLQRVLATTGTAVHRLCMGRVPIEGKILSARHGGWHDHTVDAVLRSVAADHAPEAVRLGFRLYFIGSLGPGDGQSFRHDLLRKCLTRAERLLARTGVGAGDSGDPREALVRHWRKHTYVDPFGLTVPLLKRGCHTVGPRLLSTVFL